MKYRKHFKNNRFIYILSALFIILSVINIVFVSLVQRGLTFDGTIWFVEMLQKFDDNQFFIVNVLNHRPRQFVLLINQLPVNILNFMFQPSKYWLGVFFTLPMVLFPFLCTIWHYNLAKRSQRFDLAVLGLFLYAIYVLPSSQYLVVEAMLAVCVFFVLFHYLCAKIDYTTKDIIFIVLLVLFSYNSTESIMYSGPLLFLTALYYIKDETNPTNRRVKLFIGINGLLYFFTYIAFYLISPPDFMNNSRISSEIIGLRSILLSYENIFDYILYSALIYAIFKNKKFNKIETSIIASIFISLYFYYMYVGAYNNDYAFFSRRIILYIVMPLFIICGFLFDYIRNKCNKFNINIFIHNILILVLILGNINLFLQINWSNQFHEATKMPIAIMESPHSKDSIITLKDDVQFLYRDFYHVAFSEETYLYNSILFNSDFVINRIILNSIDDIKDKNLFCTKYTCIEPQNKYWNISRVKKEYINERNRLSNHNHKLHHENMQHHKRHHHRKHNHNKYR